MKIKERYYLFLLIIALPIGGIAQTLALSLNQAIHLAQKFSPEAQAARHTYLAAYWNYRSFRANYLPIVS